MSHTEGVLTRATLDEGLGLVGDMAAPSSSADSTECALDQQIQVPWMQAVTVDHSIGYWITPHIYSLHMFASSCIYAMDIYN
jgi:hypothetical protein